MSIDYSDTVGWPDYPPRVYRTKPPSKAGDLSTRAQQRKAWWAMMTARTEKTDRKVGKR